MIIDSRRGNINVISMAVLPSPRIDGTATASAECLEKHIPDTSTIPATPALAAFYDEVVCN